MADLLREQSSLSIGLSNISDELAIRKKASRRARIYAHIESAKKELKEERGKCMREFREEVRFTRVLLILFLFQKAPLVLCFVHSRYEFQLLLPLYFCQIKETLARELSERFSGEINLLRHEVRVRANGVFLHVTWFKCMRMLDINIFIRTFTVL